MRELDHIVMTCTDAAQTQAFYVALGFACESFEDGFSIDAGPTRLFWFPAAAAGLDHLAFAARDRDDLGALAERVRVLGAPTAGVEVFRTGNTYLMTRGPDGEQVEFWVPTGG